MHIFAIGITTRVQYHEKINQVEINTNLYTLSLCVCRNRTSQKNPQNVDTTMAQSLSYDVKHSGVTDSRVKRHRFPISDKVYLNSVTTLFK